MRETIDTTYADLRPTDLVIDKSGQAWPIAELQADPTWRTEFWLCDPVTNVKMHLMNKDSGDPVKVSRLPTQADEAAKLEADFPAAIEFLSEEATAYHEAHPPGDVVTELVEAGVEEVDMPDAVAGVEAILGGTVEAEFPSTRATMTEHEFVNGLDTVEQQATILPDSHATMAEAVAAVEEIGGTVEAEVTAAEVDAAAAATDDAPVSLPPFADMTPLEQRSHLYLLHGLYGSDVTGKAELIATHDQAHTQHDAGTLQSRYVPHTHEVK